MRRPALALLAVAAMGGCPEQRTPAPVPGPAASGTSEVAAPDAAGVAPPSATPAASPREPLPDPITHPCVVTSVQFDIAFRDGDKRCQSDADCECIPLRVGDKHACSGVTSRRTGAKLRALEKEFSKLECKSTHKCASRPCQPRCVAGQCE